MSFCLTHTRRHTWACPMYLTTSRQMQQFWLAWLDPRHKGEDDVGDVVVALQHSQTSFLCLSQKSSQPQSWGWKDVFDAETRVCWIPVISTGKSVVEVPVAANDPARRSTSAQMCKCLQGINLNANAQRPEQQRQTWAVATCRGQTSRFRTACPVRSVRRRRVHHRSRR